MKTERGLQCKMYGNFYFTASNTNRFAPATIKQTTRLENAILRYESDTFSARGSRITRTEARKIANRIVCGYVENRLDGVVISDNIDAVRRRNR